MNKNLKLSCGFTTESKRKGFTLIELLVVVALIGLLSTIAVASFSSSKEKARVAMTKANLEQIATAIDLLVNDTELHPARLNFIPCNQDPEVYLDDCNAGIVCNSGFSNWKGPYMPSIPLDPWGNKYIFDADYGSARVIHSGGSNGSGINQYDPDNVVYILCGSCPASYGCE